MDTVDWWRCSLEWWWKRSRQLFKYTEWRKYCVTSCERNRKISHSYRQFLNDQRNEKKDVDIIPTAEMIVQLLIYDMWYVQGQLLSGKCVAVQYWCILSYIRLLQQSKNCLGDWGPRPAPTPLYISLVGHLCQVWIKSMSLRHSAGVQSVSAPRHTPNAIEEA